MSSSSSSWARLSSATAAASSAVFSDWQLGCVCLFFERFSRLIPSAPHFHPESLLAGLKCRLHQRSVVRSSAFGAKRAKVGDGEELKSGEQPDSHEASQCRCYAVVCQHVVHLHVALLIAAGYTNANPETWQTHFDGELHARREDWPTLEAALQREEDEAAAANGEGGPQQPQTIARQKRKLKPPRIEQNDDDQHPLTHLHYHTLSPSIKCLLLYLHTSWMLLDHAVHDLISEELMREEEPYGVDDDGNRYFLYLHPEWNENRVHLYRESKAKKAEECRFELLASNRDELEIAVTILMAQSTSSAQALIRRITDEAITELDKVGRLLERRQRRAVREAIDYRNILSLGDDDGGGRTRRSRRAVNYKELDEGEGLEVEEADDGERKTPLNSRWTEKKHERVEEDEEEEEEEEEEYDDDEQRRAEGGEEAEEEGQEQMPVEDGKDGRAEEEEEGEGQEEEKTTDDILSYVPQPSPSPPRVDESSLPEPDGQQRLSPPGAARPVPAEVEAPLSAAAEMSSHGGQQGEAVESELTSAMAGTDASVGDSADSASSDTTRRAAAGER